MWSDEKTAGTTAPPSSPKAFCKQLEENQDAEKFQKKLTEFFEQYEALPIKSIERLDDLRKGHHIIAEYDHHSSIAKRFLIENATAYRDAGFKIIFMEHLCYDKQEELDEYLEDRNKKIPDYITEIYRSLDKTYSFAAVVQTFKKLGIRVVGIDTSYIYAMQYRDDHMEDYCGEPTGYIEDDYRFQSMNFIAYNIIQREAEKFGVGEKWVALMGAVHAKRGVGKRISFNFNIDNLEANWSVPSSEKVQQVLNRIKPGENGTIRESPGVLGIGELFGVPSFLIGNVIKEVETKVDGMVVLITREPTQEKPLLTFDQKYTFYHTSFCPGKCDHRTMCFEAFAMVDPNGPALKFSSLKPSLHLAADSPLISDRSSRSGIVQSPPVTDTSPLLSDQSAASTPCCCSIQ